jgi:hypothetical protein
VAWLMPAYHLRTELLLDALNMAVSQRRPTAEIHIWIRVVTTRRSASACAAARRESGLHGSVGDCYDTALCESFFDARVRAARKRPIACPGRGPDGGVRLRRGLVQPAPPAFGAQRSPMNFERAHQELRDDGHSQRAGLGVLHQPLRRAKSLSGAYTASATGAAHSGLLHSGARAPSALGLQGLVHEINRGEVQHTASLRIPSGSAPIRNRPPNGTLRTRKITRMKKALNLYHYRTPNGNVGDDLNGTIWPKLLGDVFSPLAKDTFIAIGSILDDRHKSEGRKIVFGTGARDASTVPNVAKNNWDVRFVRGPNTARALGLADSAWITDPAIVAPVVFPHTPQARQTRIVGFVPYFRTETFYAEMICQAAGIRHIPVTLTPHQFIARLAACTHVISEAMHGAILADAYRVPWRPCRLSSHDHENQTHYFKWSDWMRSLELDSEFLVLPSIWTKPGTRVWDDLKLLIKVRAAASILKKQASSANWVLSNSSLLKDRTDRILVEVQKLRDELE